MKESKDILSLFEALSNYEIFTPPRVARDMLDLLPSELWSDPSIRLLDPCTKSGVFLREAFWRFHAGLAGAGAHRGHDGLEYNLNDAQQRTNHILKNMLYGIAISELTSYVARRTLYGVMEAHTDKQSASLDSFMQSDNFAQWGEAERSAFVGRNAFNEYYDHRLFQVESHKGFEAEGNIFYPTSEVRQKVLQEGVLFEDTYFPFIEAETKHRKILDIREGMMKFDVIIGNPPYQVMDGGAGASAKPIYNNFIEAAIDLSPRFISMITPSRWFAGGKGLDGFRKKMLTSGGISRLVDFPNAKDCFPSTSIGGGVSYFLMQRGYKGPCSITNISNGVSNIQTRRIDEFDVFIRFNGAVPIIRKVMASKPEKLSLIVESRNPFGFSSKERGQTDKFNGSIALKTSAGVFYTETKCLKKGIALLDNYSVLTSKVTNEHAGEPTKDGKFKVLSRTEILAPNEVCTDSYLCIGSFDNEKEAKSLLTYLKTKFTRFLLLQAVTSINLSSDKFDYIPMQDFDKTWTDEMLYTKYGLTQDEIAYIESMIKPMD